MRRGHFICTVILLVGTNLSAQEQLVNVRAAGTQSNAAVAANSQGFVVAWNSYYSTSGRSYDILARRFDPNGEPAGDEFQVNPTNEGNQSVSAVAMDGEGGFVVAWQGPGVDQEDVYVRVYDPNGLPRADAIAVNDDPNGRQLRPRVAVGTDGAFIVVWEDRMTYGTDEIHQVKGRWFDSSGRPLGASVQLDDGTGDARYPAIAVDSRGNSAVTWLRDRSSKMVSARLFDPNGIARTEAFEVSTSSFSSLTGPSIAMNKAGDFVIVWDGDPNRASDDDVLGRCYDPNGMAKREPFRVNSVRDGAQQWPRVAMGDAGEFVVVWQSEAQDANIAAEVFAQRFDGAGGFLGEPLQLNTYTSGNQRYPDVALMPDGRFIAVWESEGQDGSSYGIAASIEEASR